MAAGTARTEIGALRTVTVGTGTETAENGMAREDFPAKGLILAKTVRTAVSPKEDSLTPAARYDLHALTN